MGTGYFHMEHRRPALFHEDRGEPQFPPLPAEEGVSRQKGTCLHPPPLIRRKGFRGSLTLGIYNLYFRDNAFSVFFQRDERDIPQAFQLALLGTALPYATYNFVF